MSFVNRTEELSLLESEFSKDTSSFCVIYGRRRTGKTTLISKFLENKNGIYFFADTQRESIQIDRFKTLLAEKYNEEFLKGIKSVTWDSLFEYLCKKITERTVLVIDEFQYLTHINKSFSTIFQRIFDSKLKEKNIMLILCGSITSMMYSQVLSYRSPLYGRRTSQINLKSIPFINYKEFFPGASAIRLIEYFSITGGIPKYIEMFRKDKKPLENVFNEILDKNKLLYIEPRFLLQEEVNEVSTYFSILEIISSGGEKTGKYSEET